MAPVSRVVLALSAVMVATGVAWIVSSVSTHQALRTQWEETRSRLGTEDYDAAGSDRLYTQSRIARRSAGWAALLTVLGIWTLLATRRRRSSSGRREVRHVALWLSSFVDLCVATILVASLFIDDGESVFLYMLTRVAPLLAVASLALPLQVSGRTLGLRALGLRVDPHWGRPLIAGLAVCLLPCGLFVGLFRPAWAAIHLRLAGLEPRIASSRAPE